MLTRDFTHEDIQAGGWPTAEELGMCGHSNRRVRARVYRALRDRGKLTLDEIRAVAWPDDKPRNLDSINVVLGRLHRHLSARGIVLVREIGSNGTYRLGSA